MFHAQRAHHRDRDHRGDRRPLRLPPPHQPRRRATRRARTASDRASLLGIDVGRTQNVAWIVTTVIAAIAMILRAGTLGLPSGSVFGPSLLLRALAAAVIGRMEHLGVIFVAACGIGIVETAVLWNEGSATLIDPVLFVIVLGALLVQRRRREPPQEAQLTSSGTTPARCARPPRAGAPPRGARAAVLLRVLVVVGVIALPFFLDLRSTNLAAAVAHLRHHRDLARAAHRLGGRDQPRAGGVRRHRLRRRRGGERPLGPRPHRVRPARRRCRRGRIGGHRPARAAHPRPVPERHHARVRGGDVVLAPRPQTLSIPPRPPRRSGRRGTTPHALRRRRPRARDRASTSCARPVSGIVLLAVRGSRALEGAARHRRGPRQRRGTRRHSG